MLKFIIAALFLCFAACSETAQAAYDRHDGSNESCNTIGADIVVARKHHQSHALKQYQAEFKKYCKGR